MNAAPVDVAVDDRLCLALHGAARAMDAVYRPRLEAAGLTYPQYLVMSVLWEDGAQSVTALAHRLSLDPSTLSPLVKRLESRGLVERRRDRDDERRVRVEATAAGAELEGALAGLTREVCTATGLTDARQAELVARLHALTEELEAAVTDR